MSVAELQLSVQTMKGQVLVRLTLMIYNVLLTFCSKQYPANLFKATNNSERHMSEKFHASKMLISRKIETETFY